MKERREYDDEGYRLWYFEDDLEGKHPLRGMHKTQEKALHELHARLPILIPITRPTIENKKEVLKQVEAQLDAIIEKQSGEENKI